MAGFGLLVASAHPVSGPLNYLRPYIAASLIGSSLFSLNRMTPILKSGPLAYLAKISFALYVIHPLTDTGWMGAGSVAIRYLKRVGSFAITFTFAHLSTKYYESFWIDLGHRTTSAIQGKPVAQAA
jgi:peptidoglycan/LPS O-acetylase OafA/YrhL